MADPLCPTCHSKIGSNSTSDDGRVQGNEGTDANGNPVPRWTDDPLLTAQGLNGPAYQGNPDRVRAVHITELQVARQQQEEEAGLTAAQQSQFSDITNERHISRRHLIELRESTERILAVNDVTLEDYFKRDDDGDEQPQNPSVGTAPQTEWTDVSRGELYINQQGQSISTFTLPDGTQKDSPTLPGRTHIRAVHIEDLRHPVPTGTPAILVGPLGFFSFPGMDSIFSQPGPSSAMLKARKGKGALFRGVVSCSSTGPILPT